MIKALIFDVDGTLADTERDGHRPAFNAAFREFGLDWEWGVELYGELLAVTGGKERIRRYVDHYRQDWTRPADFDDLVAQLHRAKTRHYTELLGRGGIPLRPGVRRLLEEARGSGMTLAIATTTTPANVTALLQHSLDPEAEKWFRVIGAGDIVPVKKPAADIYHWTLERLELRPSECLAFEDSANGLCASQGAGLGTVVTVNDYTRDHDFDGALAVLSDLGEPDAPFLRLDAACAGERGWVDLNWLRSVANQG